MAKIRSDGGGMASRKRYPVKSTADNAAGSRRVRNEQGKDVTVYYANRGAPNPARKTSAKARKK